MMHKIYILLALIVCICLPSNAQQSCILNFDLSVSQSDIPTGNEITTTSPSSGLSNGAIVGITGGAVAGATALGTGITQAVGYFTGGLTQGAITGAAAPVKPQVLTPDFINKVVSQYPYLNKAISANTSISQSSITVKDSIIEAGSYKVTFIELPENTQNISILQASDAFNSNNFQPEINYRLFTDVSQKEIEQIFNTKQHQKLFIKGKEVILMPKETSYQNGIVKKTGSIKSKSNIAAFVTIYTPKSEIKFINYAYLILFN